VADGVAPARRSANHRRLPSRKAPEAPLSVGSQPFQVRLGLIDLIEPFRAMPTSSMRSVRHQSAFVAYP
jgi:hypothetical protein